MHPDMEASESDPPAPPEPPFPFCRCLEEGRLVARLEHAAAFPDGYPVSPGHHLVVSQRHVADFFALAAEEQADLWRLVAELRETLERELEPDGFNVGLNAERAAGQTVMHAHVHLIPRWDGDVDDPRGGVRRVVPAKARYWDEEGGAG